MGQQKKKKVVRKDSFSLPYNVEHKLQVTKNFEWKTSLNGVPADQVFQRHEELGRGSYGAVYRANHVDGFELALKEIRIEVPICCRPSANPSSPERICKMKLKF